MKDDLKDVGLVGMLLIGIPLFAAGGWVRAKVWFWLIMPLGLPAITWWEFAGMMILFKSLFVGKNPTEKESKSLLKASANLAVTLGMGYLFHLLSWINL